MLVPNKLAHTFDLCTLPDPCSTYAVYIFNKFLCIKGLAM